MTKKEVNANMKFKDCREVIRYTSVEDTYPYLKGDNYEETDMRIARL